MSQREKADLDRYLTTEPEEDEEFESRMKAYAEAMKGFPEDPEEDEINWN